MAPSVSGTGHSIRTADGRAGAFIHPGLPGAPLLVCVHGSGCTGRYFDLSFNSLLLAAQKRGHPVLLVDRPGHGVSAVPPPGSAIDCGVEAVADLIEAARAAAPDLRERPFALIGHSFGGAIALAFAAVCTDARLSAICVSGIGDRPDARAGRDAREIRMSSPHWLFGPGSSYDWRGVTALRAAAASWRAEEVEEVIHAWPGRWAAVAGAIACPVHLRLAEFERIWETSSASIDRIAASFGRSPRVDVAIAPDGGHLYEAHLRGPELVTAQLDFVGDAERVI